MTDLPFWKRKNMAEMSPSEWESLCDSCGKCCCIRLEDEDTGQIYITDVACKLFDPATCRCTDYPNRSAKVPDCVTLTIHAAGYSVQDRVTSEVFVSAEEQITRIVIWPGEPDID